MKRQRVDIGAIQAGLCAAPQDAADLVQRALAKRANLVRGFDVPPAMDVAEADPGSEGVAPPIQDQIDRIEAMGCQGLLVSNPYRRAVVAHVHETSKAARKVGSVNVIVFRDGRRYGHNTDVRAFSDSFRVGLPNVKRRTVLLLGAGSVGRSVAHALIGAGCERLMVYDRDAAAAQALSAALNTQRSGRATPVIDARLAVRRAQGIVNATPMGMSRLPGTPIDTGTLKSGQWVCDLVCFPQETALLRAASRRGCRVLSGTGTAINAALRAFQLLTGLEPDVARMRDCFHRRSAIME